MSILETVIATVKHNKGTKKLRVFTAHCEEDAMEQITAVEHCPRSAIVILKKIKTVRL